MLICWPARDTHRVPTAGGGGQFAVAGHRVGKGAPFNDLGNLKACDAVVVETQNSWEIYRVLPIDAQGAARRADAAGCFLLSRWSGSRWVIMRACRAG